jgi:hypothetical protein
MAYSHEEFNKEWHEVIRFCLIEGEMPSEFE